MKRIYFDHNATTPMAPEVLAAMLPYLTEEYGNASSIHAYGQNARGAVEQARSSVAALVGARAADIMFTSGGTESNNHAILGAVAAAPGKAKHVITSAIEHVAVLDPCRALAKEWRRSHHSAGGPRWPRESRRCPRARFVPRPF